MIKYRWILPLSLAALCLAADDPSIFHVNTQLVEVDVVVDGKHGPAANLTRNDFTLLDNGKPQQISAFSVQNRAARNGAAGGVAKAPPLPPGVVSNRLTRTGEEPASPTVILWDALNTETSDQAWVRNQVIKYLETAHPGDPVAVYILVKNLRMIQDFTDDPIPLMEALRHTNAEQSADLSAPDLADLQGQISTALTAAGAPPGSLAAAGMTSQNGALALLQKVAQEAASEMTDYALRDQVYITQAALEAIAEHLSGLPGRKKLVWISGSFPAIPPSGRNNLNQGTFNEYLDFTPQIKRAIEALNGANVAVYPIDPRGITTGATAASARPFSGVMQGIAASALAPGSLTASGIDTMDLLAGGTGGQDFYSTNDATGAIKTIMEDGQVIYRLGYYPSNLKLDGSYHSLLVKVDRKGNQIADVHARKGYFALDAKNSANGHWREKLNESMQNPLEATQLGLRASATPVQGTNNVYELAVTLDLDGLHLEHVGDRWVASIAFGTLVTPSPSTKGTLETIRVSLTESRLRAALKDGYVLRRKVVLGSAGANPGAELRVVIEDTSTGIIGSVKVPFD